MANDCERAELDGTPRAGRNATGWTERHGLVWIDAELKRIDAELRA